MTLDRDWATAEAEFRRALELNPNSATSHEKYAFFLVRTGHPRQALAEIQRSVDLDPVSASTFHAALGGHLKTGHFAWVRRDLFYPAAVGLSKALSCAIAPSAW